MSKKLVLVFAAIIFFSGFCVASAQVVINEILYAPASGSDYEWVEIKNSGDTSVDLTNYRFFHGATNSGPLTLRNGSTASLAAGDYAVIAKSMADYSWLGFSGMILSASTVSLPDSGDNTYIAISDPDKNIIDDITYDTGLGASKDSGKSLQLISSSWTAAIPTPGQANTSSDSSGDDDSNDNVNDDETTESDDSSSGSGSSTSSSSSSGSVTPAATSFKIKPSVTVRNIAYVGIPLSFQGKVTQGGRQIFRGRYFWNFGDGDFREVNVINTDKFTHTYFYPGDYDVIFEYYPDSFAETPDVSQNINIKVIEPTVSISRVGDINDFFIELSNNTAYAIDISGWFLLSSGKSFAVPKNTTIAANKKMIISGRTSGLTLTDLPSLKIATPDQKIIFEYFASAPSAAPSVSSRRASGTEKQTRTSPGEEEDSQISAEALAASVAYADDRSEDDSANSLATLIWPAAFLGFTGVSAYAVYAIRRRKVPAGSGNDFELLDE